MGETDVAMVLPASVFNAVAKLNHYIVENTKTARKSIRAVCPEKIQAELQLFTLNKHTLPEEYFEMIQPLLKGIDMGLLSEAGCPAVADPGAAIVEIAHQNNIEVVPLVGPSSIILAMMASGMNGQSFAFNGYLPIDKDEKKTALRDFERRSQDFSQSQIFIETPYRNNKLLEDFLIILKPSTKLCIAADITLSTEFIRTMSIDKWKKEMVNLHNRPTIFILQA